LETLQDKVAVVETANTKMEKSIAELRERADALRKDISDLEIENNSFRMHIYSLPWREKDG
jgi:hypothetical protein